MINIKTVCMSYLLRTKTLIIVLLSCISLTACGNSNEVPKVNPNPQKRVRIHGVFPFDKDMSLKLYAQYANDNPSCDIVYRSFGIFEAARTKKTVDVLLEIRRLEGNAYEAYYDQDHFLAGYCEWRFNLFTDEYRWNQMPPDRRSGNLHQFIDQDKGSTVLNYTCQLVKDFDPENNTPDPRILECNLPDSQSYGSLQIRMFRWSSNYEANYLFNQGGK